jgi:tetratricopeptide (TPR) repeat protein
LHYQALPQFYSGDSFNESLRFFGLEKMSNESTKKDLIFASYNRKDLEVVQTISSRLRNQGIDLWLDTQNLLAGSEWLTELEAVILGSRAAVIFKGPHGFGNFQREEISALFKLHADQKLLLIPALLPGASGKDAGVFLGNIHHVDFRLRNPDPFGELHSALVLNAPAKIALIESSAQQPERAHPLVQWIVNDMTNLKDMDIYGRRYIEAKRWPEALYIYHRLARLAIGQSNRLYADSYLQIGRIHFLAGQRDQAEKKWEIGFRIYRDYFPADLPKVDELINAMRNKAAAYSPAG